MRMKNILKLFAIFFKIGLSTFGGGYAMISLIEDECVNKINENFNEFEEAYITAVKADTVECLKKSKYDEIGEKLRESEKTIAEKNAEIENLKAKVEKYEKKEKKREKYQKKMKNQSSKPKKKNKKKRR